MQPAAPKPSDPMGPALANLNRSLGIRAVHVDGGIMLSGRDFAKLLVNTGVPIEPSILERLREMPVIK